MAKPTLATIPAAFGTKLYSVLPSTGVGDFTFTRASSATRIARTGYIETVASGDSRLDYQLNPDGTVQECPHYLLEPASTNLFTYSESFELWDNAAYPVTVTTNAIISPDGSLNGDLLTPNSGNSRHATKKAISCSATTYTISCFFKKANSQYVVITDGGDVNWHIITADLDNGIITDETNATGNITPYPNGWYRIDCTFLRTNASLIQCFIGASPSNLNLSLPVFDNTSLTTYIFGAQCEEISYPTSYIPTNGTAITRAAETATDSGDAATFNDSEGVLMFEASYIDETSYKGISISDGTLANSIRIYTPLTDNELVFRVRVNNVDQILRVVTLNNLLELNKVSLKYKENDFNIFINGFLAGTDTSGSTYIADTLNRLNFNRFDGADIFYGKAKQLQYFDSALTDLELETLTSWISFQAMVTAQLYTIY